MTRDRREEAAEHARKSRFTKAIDAYRALLSEEPDDPVLRAELADVYARSKNNERAFHHFNRAATLYGQRGDQQGALQMLISANTVSPNEPDILHRMADCLRSLGRLQELEAVLIQLVRVATAPGDRRRVRALDELFALHPDDFGVAQQRAEALAEAGRTEESVLAYTQLATRLQGHDVELVRSLQRAAEIATVERLDLGVELSGLLLQYGKARESLAILVPYYEKYPDDIGVLEALVRALDGMGVMEKVIPARIELIKARAKREQKQPTMIEIEELLRLAPEEPTVLEVSAHAYIVFKEHDRATEIWRRLATACDRRGMRLERDRAVLQLLKSNPDDEEALELGARALEEAGRHAEAVALRERLREVRGARRKSAAPPQVQPPQAPRPSQPMLRPSTTRAPSAEPMPIAKIPSAFGDDDEAGTMMLEEGDVLSVREKSRSTPGKLLRDEGLRAQPAPARPTPSVPPRPSTSAPPSASRSVMPARRPSVPTPSSPPQAPSKRPTPARQKAGDPFDPGPTTPYPAGFAADQVRRAELAEAAAHGADADHTGPDHGSAAPRQASTTTSPGAGSQGSTVGGPRPRRSVPPSGMNLDETTVLPPSSALNRVRRVLKPVTPLPRVSAEAEPIYEEVSLDDIPLNPPRGPILDPFFDEAPTSDPRESALGPYDPKMFAEGAAEPELQPEPPFAPDEITSKMEALVQSELLAQREMTGATVHRTKPKVARGGSFETAESTLPSDEERPEEGTQPAVATMELVADLIDELARPSKANGKPILKKKK